MAVLSCSLLVAGCGSGALSAQAGGTTGTGGANGRHCSLQPAVDTSIDGILVGIAAADLNGDGKLDLAVGHESAKSVLLLRNQGNATFAAPESLSVGDEPVAIAAGDLNGDGKPDLALANLYSANVSVLYNLGGGSFAPANNLPINVARDVVIVDLNGDGEPDMAVVGGLAGGSVPSIFVLLNQGGGAFAAAQTVAVGESPYALGAADVNGDGKADLIVIDNHGPDMPGTVWVLVGTGDGGFATPVAYGVNGGPMTVTAADLNADGAPDLAIAKSGAAAVSVLLNHGDGTFGAAVDYAAGAPVYAIAVADIDGDGRPDLAAAASPAVSTGTNGHVSLFLNQGNGTFGPALQYPTGPGSNAIVAADLNGDGAPDLAVANSGGYSGGSANALVPGVVSVLLAVCK
jgi:hypothetical protein